MAIAAPILLLALTLGTCACAPAGDPPLVILAASSLRELADDIASRAATALHTRVEVRTGASSTLARQLQQGLEADLFLSASDEWADAVAAVARRPWVTNRMAWVVRRDGPHPAPGASPSLALAEAGVPMARYAEALLAARGLRLPDRVVRGSNARDTLLKLVEGAADAAVVYATDAAVEPRVVVGEVLDATGPPTARTVAALLTERGRPLFEALFASDALAAARARGFEPPIDQAAARNPADEPFHAQATRTQADEPPP